MTLWTMPLHSRGPTTSALIGMRPTSHKSIIWMHKKLTNVKSTTWKWKWLSPLNYLTASSKKPTYWLWLVSESGSWTIFLEPSGSQWYSKLRPCSLITWIAGDRNYANRWDFKPREAMLTGKNTSMPLSSMRFKALITVLVVVIIPLGNSLRK